MPSKRCLLLAANTDVLQMSMVKYAIMLGMSSTASMKLPYVHPPAVSNDTKFSVLLMCSGLLPSLIGIAHVAIQFPLYEACKSWFAQRALQTRDSPTLNTLELVTASAVSKMIASTATYPHEVLRSHMHVTGSGAFNGFLQVAKEVSGAKGYIHNRLTACMLLDGCFPQLLGSRLSPSPKVCFALYADLAHRWSEGVL